MRIISLFSGAGLGICLLFACRPSSRQAASSKDILWQHIDTTVNPGTDFFDYANGRWFKEHEIPPSESSWGIGNLVEEEVYARLRKINEMAESDGQHSPGNASQKIGDFWYSGMDSADIERRGISPLQPELDRIGEVKDLPALLDEIAHLKTIGVNVAFSMQVTQDDKNSDQEVLRFDQGGLGMPNRDYYLKNDERTAKVRAEYISHLEKTFLLIGYKEDTAAQQSQAVMQLETQLAMASRPLEKLRDPYANYHKMAVSDLYHVAPSIPWLGFLQQMETGKPDSVVVGQPEFYEALDSLLGNTELETWRSYLSYHLVSAYAPALSKSFDGENFHFYGTVLSGRIEQRPRWKRVLDMEEDAMGELLGQLFVKEYFMPETRQRYARLVDAIMAAFKEHIQQLDWMSDSTKQKALFKLSRIKKKVGYPDKWKDFSALQIDRGPLVLNIMRARQWWYLYRINKLGRPVDRTEWNMTPQTYNAYYNPSNNEIVLPAAIFTIPGLPDSLADDAVIYGYAGASTIGHELTHGFDDEGRLYDAEGNLKNWWSPEDAAKFNQRAQLMVRQFNDYVVLDSLHINGSATLGENIADLGGIVLGLDAFKKTAEYQNGESIAGLTPLQRYFLGYALGWMVKTRQERLMQQVLSDVHAPAMFRVNGPMSDVPDFYKTFNVKVGQPIWRADSLRVKIW